MKFKFTLVDRESGKDKRSWVLQTPVTVGRGMLTNIHLEDGSISRRHCEFVIGAGGELVIRDLGSKNGIFVDGQQVDKATLKSGMVVQIGLAKLRVEEAVEAETTTGTPTSTSGASQNHGDETHAVKIFPPSDDDRYEIG
ncbi:FHA domain-containing protein [Roseiconus lacunae]|uniref:FHA domain-containing protein n=1 Tax=Roseiconus lacunae TaxID=2605694 RepID=A0ABT7PET2_9BACT|nr:FHA domain-containing protein [Roseiconus lacunae]MDM4014809.1 FHA domain-containing protein [Roseiconus lacunae]